MTPGVSSRDTVVSLPSWDGVAKELYTNDHGRVQMPTYHDHEGGRHACRQHLLEVGVPDVATGATRRRLSHHPLSLSLGSTVQRHAGDVGMRWYKYDCLA